MTPTDRKLVTFYRGEGPCVHGFTFEDVLRWPDVEWENEHQFIQWLFPNDRPSAFNPDAPVLTPDLIGLWAVDPRLGQNLDLAFARWLRFVGIEQTGDAGFRFGTPKPGVWARENHNWLRITRVLKCLRLLHVPEVAKKLCAFLVHVAAPRFGIPEETLTFWRGAAGE